MVRLHYSLLALLLVVGVNAFGGTGNSWATRMNILDNDDPRAREGLELQGGYYCGSKMLESAILPRYGVVITAKVVLERNEFQFRLNGDVHLSWCKGNTFFYEKDTSALRINPAPCMKDLLSKFSLHSPSAAVTKEKAIHFKVGVPSWLQLVVSQVEVPLTKCTADAARTFIDSWSSGTKLMKAESVDL